jgi:hypothetical protein
MAINTDRIALGYGNAYIAAYSSGSPVALPSDDTARDGTWSSWTSLGATTADGVKYSSSNEFRHVDVGQSTVDVFSRVTKQNVEIELTLKETSVENLKYAMGFGTLSTSGSSGVLTVTHNPGLTEYSIGLEGPSPDSDVTAAQRIQFYRCVPISEPEQVFNRDEETVVVVKFKALLHGSSSVYQIRQYRP